MDRKTSFFSISAFLLFPLSGKCSGGNDAISKGAGNSSAALINVWSATNNQAGIAWLDKFEIGINYENKLAVPELGNRQMAVAGPVGKNALGLVIGQSGYALFHENSVGISCAQQLGEQFSAGIQLKYNQLRIGEQYGTKSTLLASAGILARINDALSIGAHVYNLNGARATAFRNERPETVEHIGICYAFSSIARLQAEIEKSTGTKPNVKFGCEYAPAPGFFLRAGINTFPSVFFFGFGVKRKKIQADVAFSSHVALGYSPSVSLIYFPMRHD